MSIIPASTAALDAPMAESLILSDNLYKISKFSLFFKALPPEITTLAAVKSGLSLATIDVSICLVVPTTSTLVISSTDYSPSFVAISSKTVALKDKNLVGWLNSTVCMAFPA